MLRKIRLTLAVAVMICVTLLFLDFTGTLHAYLSWVATIQFLPALLAFHFVVIALYVVLTLYFGRIYCSVVCPLGIFQDFVAWIRKRRKKNPYTYSKAKSVLRYALLVVMVASIVFGIGSVTALLAPYSSYGRMAANLFQPIYIVLNNCLAAVAEHLDSYAFYSREVWVRSLPTFAIALLTFLVITVLAWRNGRTYCNTICPVGTLLSFLARFSWVKIGIDEQKCVKCGRCARNCKASCIDFKNMRVDHSRCVVCGNCIGMCNKKAITYRHQTSVAKPKNDKKGAEPVDENKRKFLLGTLTVAATATLAQEKKKVDGGLAVIKDKVAPERATPITPPGSLSAQNMARHCTGCQLCVAECPNDVLRPSASLDKLMQPTMSYERGYCRPECTRCSQVCPAGAIRPIDTAEKSSTQIGHAVWIKKNCVVVTDGVSCGSCARHCPAGAITMVPLDGNEEDSLMIPAVNFARCIGCGACENLCPARPFSAIYVEGHEVHHTY